MKNADSAPGPPEKSQLRDDIESVRLEVRLRLAPIEPLSVVKISDNVVSLLGYNAQDFLDGEVTLSSLVHPEDRAKWTSVTRSAGQIPVNASNIRFRHADGHIRCVSVAYAKRRDSAAESGSPDLILRDSRCLRDAGVQPILANFSAIMDSTNAMLYFKDRNHVITAVSQALCNVTSPARHWSELIGRTDYDIYSEKSADLFYRHDERVFVEGREVREVQDLIAAGGTHRWIDNRKFPVRGENGQIIGLFGIGQDITDFRETQNALEENRELLHLFIEHAPAAIAMLDREMRYLSVSRRWLQDYKLERENIIGRSHYEVFPNIPDHWKEDHRQALAGELVRRDEEQFIRPDGSAQWLRRQMRPWRTYTGAIGGIILSYEDITDYKAAMDRLRLAASVFTHAHEGITITDPTGAILDVNQTFTEITGYERDEVLGKNPSILQSGRHDSDFYRRMWRSLREEGRWSGEIWDRKKDGTVYPAMLTISRVLDSAGHVQHYVALFSDITELKDQQCRLEQTAHYDLLTKLPNRVLLADRLLQAMAQARRQRETLAVVYVDLDGFKAINDRYGHDVGDKLLAGMATQMKAALREGDTVARLGGDEFIAVLVDSGGIDSCKPALDRLLAAVSEPQNCGDVQLRVSGSIGVSFYPQSEEIDADQLLRQADQAMYQAKLAGKNLYRFFDPTQDLGMRRRHASMEDIRRGLIAGEFVLYYQPIVELRTGALVAAEALIRWSHPNRGLLPPSEFLPIIENEPLMIELGDWTLATALAQLKVWQLNGLHVRVSVNISSRQLEQEGFVERLRSMLAANPLAEPARLEIEVLETGALRDISHVSQVLRGCQALGITTALDDFGTGYSSLTYLKRLPVDILKIDQSFVRNMLNDVDDLSIIEGIMGLAAAFNRTVIAEGIESAEHGIQLLRLGCTLGQGYAIARPMPADELPIWAANWVPDPRWKTVLPTPGPRLCGFTAADSDSRLTGKCGDSSAVNELSVGSISAVAGLPAELPSTRSRRHIWKGRNH